MIAAEKIITEIAVTEGKLGRVFLYNDGADVSMQIDANFSPGCFLLWIGKKVKRGGYRCNNRS